MPASTFRYSSSDGAQITAYRWVPAGEPRAVIHIRTQHPGLPLILLGHSMGSFAVQQYLLDHSADVDAVVLTGTAAIDVLEPALDLDQPLDLAIFNAAFQPARTDYDWLSRDETIVDAYVADPYCGFGIDPASARLMFLGARRVADPAQVAAMTPDLPLYIAVGEADPVNGGLALLTPLTDRLDRPRPGQHP
jgi:alpha-beta hydrolase superfamily lysophospholipase